MLDAMGIGAFAERARRELLATGEAARKRTVETAVALTAQEAQVAQLARDGLSAVTAGWLPGRGGARVSGQGRVELAAGADASLLAFEPVWSRLAEHTYLVAIDLPGFGHSQRHDALLSPRAMAEFVIRAAGAFGLDHPHRVEFGQADPRQLVASALAPASSSTCCRTRSARTT